MESYIQYICSFFSKHFEPPFEGSGISKKVLVTKPAHTRGLLGKSAETFSERGWSTDKKFCGTGKKDKKEKKERENARFPSSIRENFC